MARYDFASDNTAGAAPEAMESLLAANAIDGAKTLDELQLFIKENT